MQNLDNYIKNKEIFYIAIVHDIMKQIRRNSSSFESNSILNESEIISQVGISKVTSRENLFDEIVDPKPRNCFLMHME